MDGRRDNNIINVPKRCNQYHPPKSTQKKTKFLHFYIIIQHHSLTRPHRNELTPLHVHLLTPKTLQVATCPPSIITKKYTKRMQRENSENCLKIYEDNI